MKCAVCGEDAFDQKRPAIQDYEHTIVILKTLLVLRCENYTPCLIEDAVLGEIDRILAAADTATSCR